MNKHKHYNAIRAFADGWEIEIFAECSDTWVKIEKPNFNTFREYRVIPDAEGWLPWYGGECPVPEDTAIEIRYCDNETALPETPQKMRWTHEHLAGDIVAYRIVGEAPKPKVKMWQWVLAHKATKALYITSHFFTTGEAAVSANGGFVVQRADWTEIEVEE